MAYKELIKNFERIRSYMREFYVYGFKSREAYGEKSARSYDNERRRIESWLGSFMSFQQEPSGKRVFLYVDSRRIPSNPLYQALGLLRSEKRGREVFYRRTDDPAVRPGTWADALAFYSEAAPLGVVGAFLRNRIPCGTDLFRYKNHYIQHALDSDMLCALLLAIDERRAVELSVCGHRAGHDSKRTVCPLKIYISTQSGRQYLLAYQYSGGRLSFFRIDAIRSVAAGKPEPQFERFLRLQERFDAHLWGVSTGTGAGLEHIEMTLHFGPGEAYILHRLDREKRHGRVELLDEHTCRFIADVYDASELLPWIRSFTGRIVKLECSNPAVIDTFSADLRQMQAIYGGEADAVQ